MEFICLLYLSRGTSQEDYSPCAKLQATVALQNDQQGFVHSTWGQSGFVKVAFCTERVFREKVKQLEEQNKGEKKHQAPSQYSKHGLERDCHSPHCSMEL